MFSIRSRVSNGESVGVGASPPPILKTTSGGFLDREGDFKNVLVENAKEFKIPPIRGGASKT